MEIGAGRLSPWTKIMATMSTRPPILRPPSLQLQGDLVGVLLNCTFFIGHYTAFLKPGKFIHLLKFIHVDLVPIKWKFILKYQVMICPTKQFSYSLLPTYMLLFGHIKLIVGFPGHSLTFPVHWRWLQYINWSYQTSGPP